MLERECSALVLREPAGEFETCSRLPRLDMRRGGGFGGWDTVATGFDVEDIADMDRLREGGGGGDLRLDVRLNPSPKPSSADGGLA
jgi:hypothetical protein